MMLNGSTVVPAAAGGGVPKAVTEGVPETGVPVREEEEGGPVSMLDRSNDT